MSILRVSLLLALGVGAGVGAMSGPFSAVTFSSNVQSNTEFVALNPQFVVPVLNADTVESLVVLSLTLELEQNLASDLFRQQPRLHNTLLQVLYDHANAGGFDGVFTSASALAPLRQSLVAAARDILGTGVADVLIVNLVRQDT